MRDMVVKPGGVDFKVFRVALVIYLFVWSFICLLVWSFNQMFANFENLIIIIIFFVIIIIIY